jgi:hypothetical protein
MGTVKHGRWAARFAVVALGALALSACQTTEDLAAADDAACAAIGITPASARYGECRLVMERKRIAERQEGAARMQAFGAAMQGAGRSLGGTAPASYGGPAGTCFKSGERTSGMNKICLYNCTGSTVARNVGSAELCPLTVEN